MIEQKSPVNTGKPGSYAELIERLAVVPSSISRLIGDRSNDDLRQPGKDGGLGVVEILCDQQDWEEITGDRIHRMLRENTPYLESYDDSLWSIEHDYASRDSDDVMTAFTLMRGQVVEALTDLTEEEWVRKGVLGEHGEVTIHWLMERVLVHDENHIAEIMEALA